MPNQNRPARKPILKAYEDPTLMVPVLLCVAVSAITLIIAYFVLHL